MVLIDLAMLDQYSKALFMHVMSKGMVGIVSNEDPPLSGASKPTDVR